MHTIAMHRKLYVSLTGSSHGDRLHQVFVGSCNMTGVRCLFVLTYFNLVPTSCDVINIYININININIIIEAGQCLHSLFWSVMTTDLSIPAKLYKTYILSLCYIE